MSLVDEDPATRSRRYIANLSQAFRKIRVKNEETAVKAANVARVADAIGRYLQDAQHYLDTGRNTTALAAVAYAEGLLDALTFLELAENLLGQQAI
jgi:hypothetical protein